VVVVTAGASCRRRGVCNNCLRRNRIGKQAGRQAGVMGEPIAASEHTMVWVHNRDLTAELRRDISGLLASVFQADVPIDSTWRTVALRHPVTDQLVAVLMLAEPPAALTGPSGSGDGPTQDAVYTLWNVAVARGHRRRGLFRELMQQVLSYIDAINNLKHRSVVVSLDVWADNRRAQKAYRALGFSIVGQGTRTHPQGMDVRPYYCMTYPLPPVAPEPAAGEETRDATALTDAADGLTQASMN
jgi:ribosomal protein S18 acetylase RimI-like enzyme